MDAAVGRPGLAMRDCITLVVLAGWVGLLGPACATTPMAGASDEAITEAVQDRLEAHPDVRDLPIDVDTQAGVVTLEGFVLSREAMLEAERVASTVTGVERIDNQLMLQGLRPDAHPQLDAWITAVVGRKLTTYTTIDPDAIQVETDGQVVTLHGHVRSELLALQAEKLAAEVEFVERVNNRLEIVSDPN